MANFNKVILMGNLTRDPQLKYLPSNMAVCEFGMAINHRWRDKEGNQREEVCFVDVSAFGRQGETINQYMAKGRPILIEGRLKYDSWTAQDGSKRNKLSVVADAFTFVGPREGGGGAAGGGAPAGERESRPPRQEASPGRAAGPPDRGYESNYEPGPARGPAGDDIPF